MNRARVVNFSSVAMALAVLLLFPSCIKTFKLVPSESAQGKEYEEQDKVAEANLRSVKVYNQWETVALFDVLWLSDQTRTSYTNLYCLRRGKDGSARDAMLVEEVAKNQNKVSFYVLADVRDKFHPSLADEDPAWTIYLEANSDQKTKIIPENIKEVELDPEILVMFGYRFSKPKFKQPYLVTFDLEKNSFDLQKSFKMVISSVRRSAELGWQGGHPVIVKDVREKDKRKLVKDDDYYWL